MPNPNVEQKFCRLDLKEVTEEGSFEGYASKFDQNDQGGDVVVKGAFGASLKRRSTSSIKMLWQHNPAEPIGVWDEIKEDATGLFVKGRLLSGLQRGREAIELIRAQAIDGLSIGYRTVKARKDETTKGLRHLIEVDLWEISLVTFPMLASAGVTSMKNDWTKRDAERVLRDAGMPNAMATKLVAGGWEAANTSGSQGDPGDGFKEISETLRRMNENLTRNLA